MGLFCSDCDELRLKLDMLESRYNNRGADVAGLMTSLQEARAKLVEEQGRAASIKTAHDRWRKQAQAAEAKLAIAVECLESAPEPYFDDDATAEDGTRSPCWSADGDELNSWIRKRDETLAAIADAEEEKK